MKNLEYNDTSLLLKSKEGVGLKDAIDEAVHILKDYSILEDIDLEYKGYLIVIDETTDEKEIIRILKDYDDYLKGLKTTVIKLIDRVVVQRTGSLYIEKNNGDININ